MKQGHRRVNCYCISRQSCRNIPSSPPSTGMTSWPEKSDPLSSQKWYEWIRNELGALLFLTEATWLTPLSSSGGPLWCQLHRPSVHTTTCTRLCEWQVPGGRGQRGLPGILLHEPGGVPGSRAGFITTPDPLGACLFSCFFFTSLIFKWVSIFKNLSKKDFYANSATYCMFHWMFSFFGYCCYFNMWLWWWNRLVTVSCILTALMHHMKHSTVWSRFIFQHTAFTGY